jgi:hypothetical protein
MPNVTINGQTFKLGYFARITERRSADRKWNEKVVEINDQDSFEIIGHKVATIWQRFCSLFYCCCGLSDEYFAEIGVNWLDQAKGVEYEGVGRGYSYVINRTKVVAQRVLKPENLQSDSAPVAGKGKVSKKKKKDADRDPSPTGSDQSGDRSPTSIESAPGRLQSQYDTTDNTTGPASRKYAGTSDQARKLGDIMHASTVSVSSGSSQQKVVPHPGAIAILQEQVDKHAVKVEAQKPVQVGELIKFESSHLVTDYTGKQSYQIKIWCVGEHGTIREGAMLIPVLKSSEVVQGRREASLEMNAYIKRVFAGMRMTFLQ